MKQDRVRHVALAIALVALSMLAACASQGSEGRESSITSYGTLDVGVSRER